MTGCSHTVRHKCPFNVQVFKRTNERNIADECTWKGGRLQLLIRMDVDLLLWFEPWKHWTVWTAAHIQPFLSVWMWKDHSKQHKHVLMYKKKTHNKYFTFRCWKKFVISQDNDFPGICRGEKIYFPSVDWRLRGKLVLVWIWSGFGWTGALMASHGRQTFAKRGQRVDGRGSSPEQQAGRDESALLIHRRNPL